MIDRLENFVNGSWSPSTAEVKLNSGTIRMGHIGCAQVHTFGLGLEEVGA